MAKRVTYHFGYYHLDPETLVLLRNGDRVPLTPKVCQTLLVLVTSGGRLITKEELLRAVWPDVTVEEGNLTQNISVLRKTFRDQGDPTEYIETIPRRGYRFLADVHTTEARIHQSVRLSRRVSLTVVALALATLAAWLSLNARQTKRSLSPVSLTADPGVELFPALSSDGTRLAYVWNGDTHRQPELYVRQFAGGAPKRLTEDPAPECYPQWSPDSTQLAFLHCSPSLGHGKTEVMLIDHRGGAKHKVGEVEASDSLDYPHLAWSHDGQSLILQDRSALILLSVHSGTKRPMLPLPVEAKADGSPAISPDGGTLAFVRHSSFLAGTLNVIAVGPDGSPTGPARPLTSGKTPVTNPMWSPDGRSIYFVEDNLVSRTLWRVPAHGGKPVSIPLTALIGRHAALTLSGDALLYSDHRADADISRSALSARPAQATQLISSTRNDANPQISPDGTKVAFESDRSGQVEIWIANSDGSEHRQLTSLGHPSGTPRWSPDGQSIAFDLTVGNEADIYVVPAAGGKATRLTEHPAAEFIPSWSRDGRWVYFSSHRSGPYRVWRVPAHGGAAQQVTVGPGFNAWESFDRRYLYFARDQENATSVWRMPVEGGPEQKVVEGVRTWVHFAIRADGIAFVPAQPFQSGFRVDLHRFADSSVRPLAHVIGSTPAFGFALAPSQQWFLFSQPAAGLAGDLILLPLPH